MISRPTLEPNILLLLGIVCSETATIVFSLQQEQLPNPVFYWLMFELGCFIGNILLSVSGAQSDNRVHHWQQQLVWWKTFAQALFTGLAWWTAAYTPIIGNLALPATICISFWLGPQDELPSSTELLWLSDRELALLMLGLAVLSEMNHLSTIGLAGIAQLVGLLSLWSIAHWCPKQSVQCRLDRGTHCIFSCMLRIATATTAYYLTVLATNTVDTIELASVSFIHAIFVLIAGLAATFLVACGSLRKARGLTSSKVVTRASTIIGAIFVEACLNFLEPGVAKPTLQTQEAPSLIKLIEHLVAIMIGIWILARKS